MPSDCKALRETARELLNELNERLAPLNGSTNKFVYYDWETDKRAKYVDDAKAYQQQVFQEAQQKWDKAECDILIAAFWHRFGEFTARELDYYIGKFIADDPNKQVLFCHYGKGYPNQDLNLQKLSELQSWMKENENKFAPLGRVKQIIKTPQRYKNELRRELDHFLDTETQE